MNWTNETGESDARRMTWDADRKAFTTTLPHVFHGFRYEIAADNARSREYHVQVVEGPAITAIELDIQPPAYTGLPARKVDGAVGEIVVFERSQLTSALLFNKPLVTGRFLWLGAGSGSRRRDSGCSRGAAPAEDPRYPGWKVAEELPLVFDADGQRATVLVHRDPQRRFAPTSSTSTASTTKGSRSGISK